MPNLFDIPELLHLIAFHLDKTSLLNCTLVSKAWTSLFVPLLWHSIRIRESGPRAHSQCFRSRARQYANLRQSAKEAIAKNGHYIRELTVEDPAALSFLEGHCYNLTKLVCHVTYSDWLYFKKHSRFILKQVWEGLVLTSPRLHTLRLGDYWWKHDQGFPWPSNKFGDVAKEQYLQHLQSLSNLRHLSVAMTDVDYVEFCARFPRIVEARFRLQSVQSILNPRHSKDAITGFSSSDGNDVHSHDQTTTQDTEMVQYSLRQLILVVDFDRLDPQMLRCVLRRFPRLERLWISSDTQNFVFLDLSSGLSDWQSYVVISDMFREMSSPHAGFDSLRWTDDEVAEIIPMLPVPLKGLHARCMKSLTIEALAIHCSETLEFVSGGASDFDFDNFDLPLEEMPTTIGLLLTRCPKLRNINCPGLRLHIRHIMTHPWVCCDHLEEINFRVIGFPKLTPFESDWVEQFYENKDQTVESLTEDERRRIEKSTILSRCYMAITGQRRRCPKLRYVAVQTETVSWSGNIRYLLGFAELCRIVPDSSV